MFDGSSEQFHQHFIASSTTSLPFPLHGFEPYPPPPPPPPPQLSSSSSAAKMEIRSDIDDRRPWSNDELLSLLKLRSTMEIWFPDFTWEHVSRKLEELGFKRSAEQCKEKFEQETRNFNCSSTTRSILNDIDEFCHNSQPLMEKPTQQQQEEEKKKESGELEENPPQEREQKLISSKNEKKNKKKKRKRRDEKYLERLKGLCEGVVKKMMEKQEHLHNQLIQELIRRDQEKIEREEAWKNQEMERIRTQFESRSNDHKSAAERQAAIIDFLNRFTSDDDNNNSQQLKQEQEHPKNNANSNSSCTKPPPRRPPSSPRSKRDDNDDVGRRWPRDEVVALINLRCRMSGETEATSSKEKGPLWERISKGMMEMGYKRSGKRCKEKWENINKYFRKTKDSSKKRSLNSRTCPYFHHLNSLYGDGTVVAPVSASAAAVVELGEERDNGGAIVDVS